MVRISKAKLAELDSLFAKSGRIALITHQHPDGDALGSTTALALYLQSYGERLLTKEAPAITPLKQLSVVVPDPYPANLSFITGGLEPIIASKQPSAARQVLENADLLVFLDLNSPSRADIIESMVRPLSAPKVLIDHHLCPDLSFFDLVFSRERISSTCELLYYILKRLCAMNKAAFRSATEASRSAAEAPRAASTHSLSRFRRNVEKASALPESTGTAQACALPGTAPIMGPLAISRPIAEALLAGMTTDTNNFANSVYPSTLEMASDLLAAGADRDLLISRLYQSSREQRLRLLGHYLQNLLHITQGGVAYAVLDSETARLYNLQDGETEGFVNQALAIDSVRASIFLREEGGVMRVSIRSKKGFSAVKLAREYFHGGGHELASGGRLRIPDDIASASEAIPYIENAVARFVQNSTDDE